VTAVTNDTPREFIRWASEEGRDELLEAMKASPRHRNGNPESAERELSDHLDTIRALGMFYGAPRVRLLFHDYGANCINAPKPTREELDALDAAYDYATHR
jgi:hypothetical protein